MSMISEKQFSFLQVYLEYTVEAHDKGFDSYVSGKSKLHKSKYRHCTLAYWHCPITLSSF